MISCSDLFRNFRQNAVCNILLLGVFALHFASLCDGTLGNAKYKNHTFRVTWNKVQENSHDYGGTYLAYTLVSFFILILTLTLLFCLPDGKFCFEYFLYWRMTLFSSSVFCVLAFSNWFDKVPSVESEYKKLSITPGSGMIMLIFVALIEVGVLLLDLFYLSKGKQEKPIVKTKKERMEQPLAHAEAVAVTQSNDDDPW